MVRRRQEEDVMEAEQAQDTQGGSATARRGECQIGQGAEGEGQQGSIGAEGEDGGVGSGGAQQADGSTALREGS